MIIDKIRYKQQDSQMARLNLAEQLAFHFALPCDAFHTYTWKKLTNLCVKSRIFVDVLQETHHSKTYTDCIAINYKFPSCFKTTYRKRVIFVSGKKGMKMCSSFKNTLLSYPMITRHTTKKKEVDLAEAFQRLKLSSTSKKQDLTSINEAFTKLSV